MKRLLFLMILMAIITTCLTAIAIIPYSEITTTDLNRSIIPDMAGNVLIKESDLDNFLRDPGSRPLPEVYPGFPVSFTNSNTLNGAIYLNMDDDPDLEIVYGVGTRIVALKLDGTAVPGWPVTLGFYVWGSPAAGDITGDGIPEIVVTSRNSTNWRLPATSIRAFRDWSALSGSLIIHRPGRQRRYTWPMPISTPTRWTRPLRPLTILPRNPTFCVQRRSQARPLFMKRKRNSRKPRHCMSVPPKCSTAI